MNILESTSRLVGLVMVCAVLNPTTVRAEAEGLYEAVSSAKFNDASVLKANGIEFGGWLEIGASGNPHDPNDETNGPVTFNNDANEIEMNELYGFIERAAPTDGGFSLGFRADFLYGTDARFSPTANLDDKLSSSDEYKLVLPQAYAEIYIPVGNGLTAKVGHFYTIIGYEVVTAPDNFFFSHAYTMQYAEPFTHTGMLMSYEVNDNWSLSGGVVSGWDTFMQEPANFLGGVSYSSDDGRTSVAVSLVTGDVDDSDKHNRTMYSVVISHDLSEQLHYVFQHDFGTEDKSLSTPQNSKWYGINQYLTYDVSEVLGAGLRVEWFRDEGGTRVTGINDHFFGITAGLNYAITPWMMLRPEVRYDWTTENSNPFDDGTDDDQFLVSADLIVTF
ncbi:MAG: hypothetical protein ACI915_005559 [Gammaproteobacteria bacterium]|jgi:hypothetical protein